MAARPFEYSPVGLTPYVSKATNLPLSRFRMLNSYVCALPIRGGHYFRESGRWRTGHISSSSFTDDCEDVFRRKRRETRPEAVGGRKVCRSS
jgi:hypothetical protein